MKFLDKLLLAVFAILALLFLTSCGTGIAYEGRFATYSLDEDGNIVIHPKVYPYK